MRLHERFSGRGHARHLCRECQRLGAEELTCRQAERDLGRLVRFDGIIPCKRRKSFDLFLTHESERVRAFALELLAGDARQRAMCCLERLAEEEAYENAYGTGEWQPVEAQPPADGDGAAEGWQADLAYTADDTDDIPF
ncbi:MAG: hypothetical protein HYV63_25555 [Candidatus Schekmanbacteria bacterium]|nr:hypothetical protein [Candidatus Schekmanbacteria bacterium]